MQYKNTKLLLIVLFALVTGYANHAQAQCNFTLEMGDAFGDGWNGGTVTIINGDSTYVFGLNNLSDDGNDSTVIFSVKDGLPIILSWQPGFFDAEVFFSLYDADGTLLYFDSIPNQGALYNGIANCPSCYKPTKLTNENIYDTRAKLRWTNVNPVIPAGWYVIYGKKGFVPGPGVGDTAYTTLPKVTLTGLEKKTEYDWYLRQDCGNNDLSLLTGPVSFETYWSNDVGVVGVEGPQTACDLGVETVKILMKNFGSNPQSLIPFRYSVNGEDAGVPQPQDGFYTGVLGKDSTELIAFETTYDFSEAGEYLITVYTQMGGDEDFTNDTFNYYIVNRLTAPYKQDFEVWSGGWYVDTASVAPSWVLGDPEKMDLDTAASGVNAWLTSLTGGYNLSEKSYLASPCFDFSEASSDPYISFALYLNLNTFFDAAFLEMSLDDGATWKKVGAQNEGLNWYNTVNSFQNLGDVWSASTQGWVNARHQLTGAQGQAQVRLRFALFGSPFSLGNLDGMGVDDIRIDVPFVKDLAGQKVSTLGQSSECGLQADKVTFVLSNLGSAAQSFFKVAYSVNGGTPVVENLNNVVLAPDASYTYVFNTPFDSRDGAFEIKCWPVLTGEQQPTNDTVIYNVRHLPLQLPLKENFEALGASGLLPSGWKASAGFVGNGHANVSYVYYVNMYDGLDSFALSSPRYGVLSSDDSLNFQYRITNWNSNGAVGTVLATGTNFKVQVSDDCGGTFTTLYTIDKSNHTPTANLRKVFVDLASYAGKSLIVRFVGNWTAGDFNFDLDNINLDAGISATTFLDGLTLLTLQPNPTTGYFTIRAQFEQAVENLQVSVFDLVGNQLWSQQNDKVTDLNAQFDLSAYPAGMYFVRLMAEGKILTKKIVKQ